MAIWNVNIVVVVVFFSFKRTKSLILAQNRNINDQINREFLKL